MSVIMEFCSFPWQWTIASQIKDYKAKGSVRKKSLIQLQIFEMTPARKRICFYKTKGDLLLFCLFFFFWKELGCILIWFWRKTPYPILEVLDIRKPFNSGCFEGRDDLIIGKSIEVGPLKGGQTATHRSETKLTLARRY